jgi:hypothetical protein
MMLKYNNLNPTEVVRMIFACGMGLKDKEKLLSTSPPQQKGFCFERLSGDSGILK